MKEWYKCPNCNSREFIERVAFEKGKGKQKIIWHRNPPIYCEKCRKGFNYKDLKILFPDLK